MLKNDELKISVHQSLDRYNKSLTSTIYKFLDKEIKVTGTMANNIMK